MLERVLVTKELCGREVSEVGHLGDSALSRAMSCFRVDDDEGAD